jgi:hypothetical protein
MERDLITSHPEAQGLEVCRECGRPFVVPVALLDLIDEGLYLLALHCKNCDRLAVGVHEDAELELADFAHDRALGEILTGIEIAEVSRFIDEMTGFSRALEDDLVLPEDF